MKVYIIIGGILYLSIGGAFAQQRQPSEYNFKVKAADVEKLGKALGKLPYEEVIDLMQSLRTQVIEQQAASSAASSAASKPTQKPK